MVPGVSVELEAVATVLGPVLHELQLSGVQLSDVHVPDVNVRRNEWSVRCSCGDGIKRLLPGTIGGTSGFGAEHLVRMTDRGAFEPAQIKINVGDTVLWRNDSGKTHSVTADPEKAADRAGRCSAERGGEIRLGRPRLRKDVLTDVQQAGNLPLHLPAA